MYNTWYTMLKIATINNKSRERFQVSKGTFINEKQINKKNKHVSSPSRPQKQGGGTPKDQLTSKHPTDSPQTAWLFQVNTQHTGLFHGVRRVSQPE